MMRIKHYVYPLHEVAEYINWIYFFHAWGFGPRFASIADVHGCDSCRAMWLTSFPEDERAKAAEAMQLHKEAMRMIDQLDGNFHTHGVCRLCVAYADGDDLLLDGHRFPLLRQQTNTNAEGPYLCLSDFVRPLTMDEPDCVGVFATTVEDGMEALYTDDPYKHLLVQTLADRLAEATAEVMHRDVRREFWGYVPNENLSIKQLHREEFQGIRPAVGYPSLPDQSVNFLLDELLDMKKIGITLTEHGAMLPHASVSGMMMAHPAAHYFSIGQITREQLTDYATRRRLPIEELEKYLSPILLHP
ncbi:MAG: 5-methyltetrahydrofolate--homocysteine methyltransferase [Bacteroidaceae bacterium]|nr:5-methyltetrahydrofolate--homocysteine methyltransferase [Bacteroidaceae bacterium]